MMIATDLNQNIVLAHQKIKNNLTLMKCPIKKLFPMTRYITQITHPLIVVLSKVSRKWIILLKRRGL